MTGITAISYLHTFLHYQYRRNHHHHHHNNKNRNNNDDDDDNNNNNNNYHNYHHHHHHNSNNSSSNNSNKRRLLPTVEQQCSKWIMLPCRPDKEKRKVFGLTEIASFWRVSVIRFVTFRPILYDSEFAFCDKSKNVFVVVFDSVWTRFILLQKTNKKHTHKICLRGANENVIFQLLSGPLPPP